MLVIYCIIMYTTTTTTTTTANHNNIHSHIITDCMGLFNLCNCPNLVNQIFFFRIWPKFQRLTKIHTLHSSSSAENSTSWEESKSQNVFTARVHTKTYFDLHIYVACEGKPIMFTDSCSQDEQNRITFYLKGKSHITFSSLLSLTCSYKKRLTHWEVVK